MSVSLFKNFDFSLLDSPDFKEDSVREELITPLLHTLGYKAHGEFKILRSKPLIHPFVMIGSKKHKINIVPDYLLQIRKDFAMVLDAKRPNQKIINDTNVEQVYSYAIHPEVRVNLYALCNGRELVVFHISCIEPIFKIALQDVEKNWSKVDQLLSPYNILNYELRPRDLYPDYGLHLYKLGYSNQYFYDISIDHITRVDNQTFSTVINLAPDGVEFALSFDFDSERLIELINLASPNLRIHILDNLQRQPYKVDFPPFTVDINAKLGSVTQTKFEDIIPMVVRKFGNLDQSLAEEMVKNFKQRIDLD